jgi:hypothetical protein
MAVDITINETIDAVDITVNPNIIEVNVTRTSGGGGGSQTLAQTLDLGNSTGGENILINTADAIELENTSSLQKGTYNFGGNGGISRICSNQYEDMWQNGFRHVFDQSGFIRNSSNGFDIVPDSSFDVTLRFKVGSFWSLDNGTTYICTDATEGAAVWELYSVGATPTLQQVTDEGNTTDNDIIVRHSTDNEIIISSITDNSQISVNQGTASISIASQENAGVTEALIQMTSDKGYNIITEGAIQLTNSVNNNSIDLNDNGLAMSTLGVNQRINLSNGVDDVSIKTDLITEAGLEQQLPDKSGTFAMLDDIPTKTSDLINDGDNGTSHFISLEDLPSTLTLYPTTAASGIGGYNKLVSSITDPDYNTVAVDVSTGAITGTDQLIAGLITDANQIVGNPGVFNMTTIGNIRKTSGSGQAEFFFRVYKRDAGGTETLILQSDNTQQITSAIYAEFNTSGLWNDGVFISTDRIIIKFYGTKVGGGSNPTYDFKFGGTNPVRSIVPVPLTVIPVLSLDEISDVTISAATNNQLLSYTSATDIWENKSIASILGYSPIKKIVSDTTSSSAVTGVTTETLCKTYTISANTFADGDFIKVLVGLEKTGVLGTATARIRVNQTNNFATATLVGTYTSSAGSHTALLLKRDFLHFKSGVLKGISFNTNNQSDLAAGASIVYSTTTLSPTSDFYFYVSVINANAGDSTIVNQVQITN